MVTTQVFKKRYVLDENSNIDKELKPIEYYKKGEETEINKRLYIFFNYKDKHGKNY